MFALCGNFSLILARFPLSCFILFYRSITIKIFLTHVVYRHLTQRLLSAEDFYGADPAKIDETTNCREEPIFEERPILKFIRTFFFFSPLLFSLLRFFFFFLLSLRSKEDYMLGFPRIKGDRTMWRQLINHHYRRGFIFSLSIVSNGEKSECSRRFPEIAIKEIKESF